MTALIQRVAALTDRSMQVRLAVPNDTGHIDLDVEIAAAIVSLIDESNALLSDVGSVFEESPGGGDGDDPQPPDAGDVSFLRAIGAEISHAMARQEIADLAFLSRQQLLETKRQITAARATKALWSSLAHSETGLRRLRKALVAIESALREYEGLEPIPRNWESVDDALEIRRIYSQFRRSVTRYGMLDGSALRAELRRMTRRIAILRDRTIYPYLRIEDRRGIRLFQKRIERWLEGDDGSDDQTRAGERLWQDLVGFAGLLCQVNRRQSLCEHDRELLTDGLRIIAERASQALSVPPTLLESMQTLLGRDDELDGLLLDPTRPAAATAWRVPLTRLLDELEQPYRGTSP